MIRSLVLGLALLVAGCGGGVASSPHFTRGPGAVLAHPRVHLVSWGGAPVLDDASAVVGDVFARCAEYGVEAPTGVDVEAATPSLEGSILDPDLYAEVNREITSGALPEPTSDDVYEVFLPAGDTTAYLELTHSTGYHLGTSVGGVPYALAIVTGDRNIVGTHELVEAVTDPAGLTWRDWSTADEVADVCEDGPPDTIDGVQVAKLWSQAKGACE